MLPVPDLAAPNLAVIELTSYLHQVSPDHRKDTFSFWCEDGRPDPCAARSFKAAIDQRIAGADTAHLIGLQQRGHEVELCFMPVQPETAADPAALRAA